MNRAKAIRGSPQPPLRVLGPHELRVEDDDEISAEDREQALAQVEQAMARSRQAIAPETLAFRPRRRGALLPLLANLLAVAVIAAGVALALRLSRRAEQEMAAGPATILSAEGKVLETLREEARRELEGKDREIAAIREKLAGIDGERQRIREAADAAVRQREQELADSFARSLEQERARLSAAGLSEDAIAKKLLAFETTGRSSMEERLAAFREEQRAELQQSEQAIEKLQGEYQAELSRAQADRNRVQEDAARRQAELEAGYREKQIALEKDKAAALDELARLRGEQERERLAADQLLSYYARARDQIGSGRPDGALAAMADLRRYLDEPAIAALPSLSRRRPVDLFLADSLEQMVRAQAAREESSRDVQGLVASASLVAAAAELVQQGDALFAEEDYAKARSLYLSALARIPASRAGYERLSQIEEIYAGRAGRAVASAMSAGNTAYRAGDYDGAVASYGSALQMMQVERGTVDRMVAQLVDIGSLRKAAEVARTASAQPDLVAQAASLVSEGDALFAGHDYARAREKYLSALARIPAVQAGYARLSEIDRMDGESAVRAVGSALAAGDEAYAAGDFDVAVERYGTALQMLQGEPGAAEGLVARLIDIGSQRRASEMAVAAPAPPAQPDLVAEAGSLVAEGDALFAAQDYARAREMYLSALARIPASEAGHAKLAEIERISAERASQAVAAALVEGNAAYAAGNYDAAVERYGSALQMLQVEKATADTVVAQLIDIGSLRKASEIAAAAQAAPAAVPSAPDPQAEARARSAAWLEALRARLATAGASPAQVTATGDTLVALLETKLLVQKTLLSPEVAAQHPDLYDRLEKYLEALAEETRADAQLAILRDLDGMLAEAGVAEPEAAAQPDGLASRYPAAEQRSVLARILERLQALLR